MTEVMQKLDGRYPRDERSDDNSDQNCSVGVIKQASGQRNSHGERGGGIQMSGAPGAFMCSYLPSHGHAVVIIVRSQGLHYEAEP